MTNEILIVDDNPDIRNILEELISDLGYKTRVAANYQQALSEIDKKLPDVALLDVKLSNTENNEGLKLLDHIKSKNKDIPVIIISGHANIEMAVDSLRLGAFEFIQKPFDKDRLTNFVNRAVENFNLKKENKSLNDKLFNSFDIIGIVSVLIESPSKLTPADFTTLNRLPQKVTSISLTSLLSNK